MSGYLDELNDSAKADTRQKIAQNLIRGTEVQDRVEGHGNRGARDVPPLTGLSLQVRGIEEHVERRLHTAPLIEAL